MQFFDDEDFSWRVLAVESTVIMLSVLLGFTLNGWRQSASEQETVDAALKSIAAETRQNKQRLKKQLPYFRDMSSTLDSLSRVPGAEQPVNPLAREMGAAGVPGWHGLQLNPISTFSYQAASSAGALAHMDYDLTKSISSIRLLQDSYLDAQDKIMQASLSDDIDSVSKLALTFGLRARLAGLLLDKYDALLNTLSKEHGIDPEPRASTDSSPTDTTRAAR